MPGSPQARPPFFLVAVALGLLLPLTAAAQPGTVETVVLFDSMALETPESVVVDRHGTLFVGSAFTAEIFSLTPDGTLGVFAALPVANPGVPCVDGGLPAILGALTLGVRGTLYANFAACDLEHRGVWRLDPDGSAERIVPLGPDILPNGIARVDDRLYIADSLGQILTAPITGGSADQWSADPSLAEDPDVFGPGPNGIQYFEGELYVANSDTAQILAFELLEDGSAGDPRLHVQLPVGCDDFAFDIRGAMFCTTDPANTVLEISPDGQTITTIADDLFDGPTAAAFGRRSADRLDLYVTNAAFPFFTTMNRPSLMKVELEHPGLERVTTRR
ncbi:MAG: SMP-30/gluconolactonase/LRE family protein [Acidobacteriota bacterium]